MLGGLLASRKIIGGLYFNNNLIRHIAAGKGKEAEPVEQAYRCTLDDLNIPPATQAEILYRYGGTGRVHLADIDQDGFFLSEFDLGDHLPTVKEPDFRPRNRFKIALVYIRDQVCIKKTFSGDQGAFVADWRALTILSRTKLNVPPIIETDLGSLSITHAYIAGKVLREELARLGSIIRDKDIEKHFELGRMDKLALYRLRTEEGRWNLLRIVDKRFIADLFRLLHQIHNLGFFRVDIKPGNVIIEQKSGRPYLIDFDNSIYSRKWKKAFRRILANRDICTFRTYYGNECIDPPENERGFP